MALVAAYGGPYFVAACLKIVQDILGFLQPQLLRMLLAYISDYQDSRRIGGGAGPGSSQGFVIVGAMFVVAVVQSIILGQACFYLSIHPSYRLILRRPSIFSDATRQA